MFKSLVFLFLLAYLADMTNGMPFQRRGQRQSAPTHASSWSNNNFPGMKVPEEPAPRRNEYAIIHEARRNRHMSKSRSTSAVRTKPFRRSPSNLHKAKGKGLLFPIHHEAPPFSAKSAFIPEPRRSVPQSSPWQKAPGKMSNIRKVPVPDDPEYIY